ncbi:DNA helicase [Stappia sp. ES.058]|uniref:DNA helicase n=1 Tax=Stappia sp. ES.058 TaxID=1881061 RepID=UPI00087CBB16|nr:DNA helicase [Stappia sp. ES.058]SDU28369.1 DnaB-like helicase C terminal domain-containing protein [Stappia sp. ES.058]
MRLTAPIYRLKRRARLHARETGISLNAALDHVAREEGHARWSLLAAQAARHAPARRLLARLSPGDTLLLAARPGQGKTALALDLLQEAAVRGRMAVFFSLFYAPWEAAGLLTPRGAQNAVGGTVCIETPDALEASLVGERMAGAASGSLAVIDYLQLLARDEGREANAREVAAFGALARERGLVIVFLSQVARGFDPALSPVPGVDDLAAPWPGRPDAFSRTCFLHEGEMRLSDPV